MKQRSTRRRPTQERSRALWAALEEAAAHVLMKHGYEGASTARIAERAGVSIGSLYQYFDDKDAVFDALEARILDGLLEAAELAISRSDLTLPARIDLASARVQAVLAPFPGILRQLAAVPGPRFQERLSDARYITLPIGGDGEAGP